MNALRLVGISGNTRRPSRTRALVEQIGREVVREQPMRFELHDLVDAGPGLGAFSRGALPSRAEAILQAIEGADALIVASPVYKGSYSGLFKHLFDFVEAGALAGVPVVLAATGGGRRHALVVEHQLRPLFAFFSALSVPTSIYASDEDFEQGELSDPVTLGRIRQAASELSGFVRPASRQPVLTRVA